MESKPLTGVRKRQQIASTNKQMMIWVGSAAAIVTICAMVAFNLFQHIMYQAKVITEITKTDETLRNNIEIIPKLMNNINALQTNSNLLALRADSNDTAFNVILDALPTSDDRTALGSSMQEKILAPSSVTLESFDPNYSGTTTTTTTAPTSGTSDASLAMRPAARPLPFSFTISGNYESIQKALKDIERTIRPIVINTVLIQGSDTSLKASLTATTHYAPKATYTLGSKTILPDGATAETASATNSSGGTN